MQEKLENYIFEVKNESFLQHFETRLWYEFCHEVGILSQKPPSHSGRRYYIDLLLIKMAVMAMFQENWSQFRNPSTN